MNNIFDDEFDKAVKEIALFTMDDTLDILEKSFGTDSLYITFESVINITFWLIKNLNKYKKGTVDNMNTPKFILHTNSYFIKDGAYIEDVQDIISLIDYFNLTKEKYHFDILTIDGYIECFQLFLEYIGTKYEETIESMLSEYQRYLRGDCNE